MHTFFTLSGPVITVRTWSYLAHTWGSPHDCPRRAPPSKQWHPETLTQPVQWPWRLSSPHLTPPHNLDLWSVIYSASPKLSPNPAVLITWYPFTSRSSHPKHTWPFLLCQCGLLFRITKSMAFPFCFTEMRWEVGAMHLLE